MENRFKSFKVFEEKQCDYIIGAMIMHHLLALEKKEILKRSYGRIKRGLKRGGLYIEGDYVVSKRRS